MFHVIIEVALIVACVMLKISLDKLSKDMLLFKIRVQNVEAEVFVPVVQAEMPDKTIQTRVTLCGAMKTAMEILNKKSTTPKIIIPGRRV